MEFKPLILALTIVLLVAGCTSPLNTTKTNPCSSTNGPVCGSNGITYQSSCLAIAANTIVASQGECYCQDSHSSKDVYTQGSVATEAGTYNNTCINNQIVKEYYCNNNQMSEQNIQCQNGYNCMNGECVQASACTGGNDSLFTQGTVSYDGSEYSDYCINNSAVAKYNCENGVMNDNVISCPSGYACSSGQCMSNSNSCTQEYSSINLTAQNTVTVSSPSAPEQTYQDYCDNSNTVRKYYCSGSSESYQDVSCAYGSSCDDGVCISPNISCNVTGDTSVDEEGYSATSYCSGSALYSATCSGGHATTLYSTTCASGYTCDAITDSCDLGTPTCNLLSNGTAIDSTGYTTSNSCSGSTFYEANCSQGHAIAIAIPCSSGYSCSDGTCELSSSTCSVINGSAIDNTGQDLPTYCAGNTLEQATCTDGYASYSALDCTPGTCSNGGCSGPVTPSSTPTCSVSGNTATDSDGGSATSYCSGSALYSATCASGHATTTYSTTCGSGYTCDATSNTCDSTATSPTSMCSISGSTATDSTGTSATSYCSGSALYTAVCSSGHATTAYSTTCGSGYTCDAINDSCDPTVAAPMTCSVSDGIATDSSGHSTSSSCSGSTLENATCSLSNTATNTAVPCTLGCSGDSCVQCIVSGTTATDSTGHTTSTSCSGSNLEVASCSPAGLATTTPVACGTGYTCSDGACVAAPSAPSCTTNSQCTSRLGLGYACESGVCTPSCYYTGTADPGIGGVAFYGSSAYPDTCATSVSPLVVNKEYCPATGGAPASNHALCTTPCGTTPEIINGVGYTIAQCT